ncbi:MAG TPA: ATP-binding protein [Azospirillaceae bacterium]|nr:ATP-binding protein [Azospirillaceae bacterium]
MTVTSCLILLGSAAVLVAVWWRARTEAYALDWAATSFFTALTWFCLATVPQPVDGGPVPVAVAADLSGIASFLFLARGTARYARTRFRPAFFLACAALGLAGALAGIALDRPNLRELALGGFLQAMLVPCLWWLWRRDRRDFGGLAFLAGVFAIFLSNGGYTVAVLAQAPVNAMSQSFGGLGILMVGMPAAGALMAMTGVLATALRLVDQLRAQAAELERIAAEAQRANRAKTDFLAMISHEIRTPANAVLTALELVSHGELDLDQARFLELARTSGRTLVELLDQILDMSRLEAGRLPLQPVPLDLRRLAQEAVDVLAPRAAAKRLDLRLEIDGDLPARVLADPVRLRQILVNLVGNAVKFTESGRVRVTVAAGPASDGAVPVSVAVEDTGIGIPREKLDAIFEPFAQADGSITRRYGGAGLGLAIADRLARQMGGGIRVESEAGRGSTFRLEVPLVPTQGGAAPEAAAGTGGRATLLLVEDDPASRLVTGELLRRQGYAVLEVTDGAEAVERVRAGGIDLVLMDLGMPGLDGFMATARIRALPGAAARLPVLALTASVVPEIAAKCREAGMQGFVGKPIRLPDLLTAVESVLAPATQAG